MHSSLSSHYACCSGIMLRHRLSFVFAVLRNLQILKLPGRGRARGKRGSIVSIFTSICPSKIDLGFKEEISSKTFEIIAIRYMMTDFASYQMTHHTPSSLRSITPMCPSSHHTFDVGRDPASLVVGSSTNDVMANTKKLSSSTEIWSKNRIFIHQDAVD